MQKTETRLAKSNTGLNWKYVLATVGAGLLMIGCSESAPSDQIITDQNLIDVLTNLPKERMMDTGALEHSVRFLRAPNGNEMISNISKSEQVIYLFSADPKSGATCMIDGTAKRNASLTKSILEEEDCSLTLTKKGKDKISVSGQAPAPAG